MPRFAMPSISVIIPVFNREKYLREALQTVFAQTRPADEIIVIDDGSTDGSAEVARSFGPRVQCISQENQGIGPARNTGLGVARGDLIAFLDSDDLWLETKLEKQAAYLEKHPEKEIVFCRMKPFLSPEIDPAGAPPFDDRELDGYNSSALLAYRKVFDRVGLFETGFRVAEFVSWFERAQHQGIVAGCLPELLFRRRVHSGNSVHARTAWSDYLRVLKRKIDRGRGTAQVED